ncbi:interleukin-6 receptor subunit alpha [Pseudophryne corroboree]|uniref:interleukin-6 receptor subunit alpha n=1 Tax=Pseudophryne corroboree TaxID=495146 RepID=UPI003081D57D
MVVITGRWYSYLMTVALLTFAESQRNSCAKPALSEKTTLVPLLSSVTLTCPGCEGRVSWIRQSQQVPPRPSRESESGHLVLKAVTYRDEDNYTCYRDGAPLCVVELLVKDELEKPEILCYLRHPAHNITCEWKPTRNLHPLTKVTLTAWSITGNHTVSACSFISSTETFACSSPYSEGDNGQHTLSVCVTSRTDSQSSNTVRTSMHDQVRPDPPINITVTPVENQPRRLNVSWRCPQLWVGGFYQLEYQVQYRVENSQHVSNGTTTDASFVINDALMGRRHVIRVRAKEEFGTPWGSWSEEAVGTPWSEEEEEEAETQTSLAPSEYYSMAEYQEEDPENDSKEPTVAPIPRYPWLVAGLSATVAILLFMIILIRQHDVNLLSLKERLLRIMFQSLPKVTRAQPLQSEALMLPFPPPTSVTVCAPMLPDAD